MSLFPKRTTQELYVIEVKDRSNPLREDEESIQALANHPGFLALTQRLQLQRSALRTLLETKKHTDIRSVDDIQAGLKWLDYLSAEVDKTVFKKAEAKAVAVRPTERVQFEKVFAQIEGV